MSLIISGILFLVINVFSSHFDFSSQSAVLRAGFTVNSENQNDRKSINSMQKDNAEEELTNDWYLEIPTIELNATIAEGTTQEVMNQFIGHFEESKKWAGNVCLAAHNRGYENNYFSEVKTLKEGDEIIYHYKGSSREYVVKENIIIQDTDLACLENTEDNMITLITCVENEPNYRRCVKAIEK